MKVYDLAVVGTGLAGAIAAVFAAEAGLSVLALDKGQGLKDRRSLCCGWLGSSLHAMSRIDLDESPDGEMAEKALYMCRAANGGWLEHHPPWFGFPDGFPFRAVGRPHYVAKAGCGHELAQHLHARAADAGCLDLLFGTLVEHVGHEGGRFVLRTGRTRFEARRCLLATGNFSAEWLGRSCSALGLDLPNPDARVGLRIEVPSRLLRAFLQLAGDLSLAAAGGVRLDDLRRDSLVGENEEGDLFSAFAHALPGHSSGRTSFMASVEAKGGFRDAARIARIVNTLSNDKMRRERAVDFMHGHSVLEHLEQFDPIRKALQDLDQVVPSFLGCAVAYMPEVKAKGALPVDAGMRTAFPGLYGAGRCTTRAADTLGTMVSALTAIRSMMEE
jgi:hypothetical protein